MSEFANRATAQQKADQGILETLRADLDRIDAGFLGALGARVAVCRSIARYKREHGVPMRMAHLALDGTLTVPLRAEAESLSAAIDFAARDYAGAQTHQRRALELAATEADRRQALAKLKGLDSAPARDTLGRALYADVLEPDIDPVLTFYLLSEYARLFPTDRLGPYLLGRQLLGRDAARALPQLTRACGNDQVADSPERARVEAAGWQVGFDGMEIDL